ncbi:hypothetical protein [Polynucleobacter sp. MWH-UH2A]|uniref:hypothetical protein n=1 Tax=Polynucleobacter sp. MWH-UH2A TaxID=1855617 RepID=UPI001BFD7166|nr:hypothetical protein [Polynucleobacter sp. MWH-UH2A]QWD64671.1 hypothetical protein IC571_03300 [Polynucleobacter sp. MWH-UH2A]
MSEPQRHDIFEDENGTRVAVRQIFPPNALGITYVEYKNLSNSNLQFLPKEEFLEKFKWLDNFSSTDTFAKVASQNVIAASSNTEGEEKGLESDNLVVEGSDDVADERAGGQVAPKPSRTE